MSSYMLYYLTDELHIVDHRVYDGDDDLAAVDEARLRADGHIIDVWQDKRRVAMVKKGYAPLVFSNPRTA